MDFFTPIVNDPYTFGAIATTNALSDIYAMGARPGLALNLVGFPVKTLPMGMLDEILRGGATKLAEAGVRTPLPVELMLANNPDLRQTGEVIQSMAAEAGFDVKMHSIGQGGRRHVVYLGRRL